MVNAGSLSDAIGAAIPKIRAHLYVGFTGDQAGRFVTFCTWLSPRYEHGGLRTGRVDFLAFSLPLGQLIVFGVMTIIVGILAAIFPARRAAKLNPLEALQYE